MSGQQGGRGMQVQMQGLSKVFIKGQERIDVLTDLNLDIAAGDRISIVGESGSGKSTFLHILGTLDRPSSGKVLLDGQDVFSRPAREVDALRNREIGFIFQFHHLLPDHNALYNVMMPAIIAGANPRAAEARAESLLRKVGLGARLTHKPGKLSGGEQQRVAIARAMMRQPALLLADEPTGNLDPRTSGTVLEMMLALHEEVGSTLVVVTHSRDLANQFSRRLNLVGGRFEERS